MAAKSTGGTGRGGIASSSAPAVVEPTVLAQGVAWWALVFVLCGTAWLVDPGADASFDAPKRLCLMLGAAIAALALGWSPARPAWTGWSRSARGSAVLAALGLAWLVLASIASPHPDIAWPALRRLLTIALLVPAGASALLDGVAGSRLLVVVLLVVGSNLVISLLQSLGLVLPFDVVQLGGRFATGALLGNEGFVALAGALLVPAALALLKSPAVTTRQRGLLVALVVLALAVIVLNQQKTSAVAVGFAVLVMGAVRWRQRWLLLALAASMLFGSVAALLPPLRAVTWQALPIDGIAGYQRLTTYRLGAWIAAIDMAQERPLFGFGPGTFGAEAQVHRLAAELRLRERLSQPTGASFVYAHQEYLQLAAEAGLPALGLWLAALLVLLLRLVRLGLARTTPERLLLLGVLSAGACAALAWFPLQIPLTAAILLLGLGRAWREIARAAEVP